MPRFSLIIPVRDQMRYSAQCLESIDAHTDPKETEVIVIDNGSQLPVKKWLEEVAVESSNFTLIQNPDNLGFPRAINQGLEVAKGNLLVWLNNDAVLTPQCLERMEFCLRKAAVPLQTTRLGLVGPASNYAPGPQHVSGANYGSAGLERFAEDFAAANEGNWILANMLSGFFLMMYRQVYEDVGPLEDYFPGGWEDNAFCHRAAEKGWKCVVAGDTFVHHYGSRTLKSMDLQATCDPQFWPYIEQHAQYKEQKLVAIYRVKNSMPYIERCIRPTCELVDEALFWVSPSDDNTAYTLKHIDNAIVKEWPENLTERQIRNNLITWAEQRGADWILSMDDDERFERKVDRAYLNKLMNPPMPSVYRYGFPVYTFWDDFEHVRQDGIFGQMVGPRLFRNLPYQHVFEGAPSGLHAGHSPAFGTGAERFSSARILHYGYVDREERERKYRFYEEGDRVREERYIGAIDYRHLIQQAVATFLWKEDNGISFVMLSHNEEARVRTLLDDLWGFYDEAIIGIDSRTTDKTREVCEHFGAQYYEFDWGKDFSAARNDLKARAQYPWILTLDPDEAFQGEFLPTTRRMTEGDYDFYLFNMLNHKPDGTTSPTERVSLFRNLPWLYYSGPVHENFDACFAGRVSGGLPIKIHSTGIPIQHFGFMKTPEEVEEKHEMYVEMDITQMKEHPEDPKPPFNLALFLRDDGKVSQSMQLLQKAAELDPGFFQPRRELSVMHMQEAMKWIKDAAGCIKPTNPLRQDAEKTYLQICELLGLQGEEL